MPTIPYEGEVVARRIAQTVRGRIRGYAGNDLTIYISANLLMALLLAARAVEAHSGKNMPVDIRVTGRGGHDFLNPLLADVGEEVAIFSRAFEAGRRDRAYVFNAIATALLGEANQLLRPAHGRGV